MRRSPRSAVALALLLLLTSSSGCATPKQRARTVMALGAITVVAGLLVAGDCKPGNSDRANSGADCSGTPDAEDAAKGTAIVGLGAAMMAAGAAMDAREEPRAPEPRDEPPAVPPSQPSSEPVPVEVEPTCAEVQAQDGPEACGTSQRASVNFPIYGYQRPQIGQNEIHIPGRPCID